MELPVDTEVRMSARAEPVDADLNHFCRTHLKELEHFVRTQCRDRSIVDDVVQETVMATIGAWPRIRLYERPMGWVIRTAMRIANRMMKQSADRNIRSTSLDILLYEPFHEPMTDTEAEVAFHGLLARLSPRQAAVMYLDFRGYTVAEIAALLEIEQTTVRGYRTEARRRMQTMIDSDLRKEDT
jgi:RNA polymerase sigma-70 factor (ECF subfamily)